MNGVLTPVTRYRTSKNLQAIDLPHLNGRTLVKDAEGHECLVFTADDFGVISSDDELRVFLNKELAKDPLRLPNDVQKEVNLVRLKKQKHK